MASFLRAQASRINSKVLSALAMRVQYDPFKTVKKMIEEMFVKLMKEANEEAEHKGWCDTELSTNEQTRKEKTAAVETLHAEIDQLEASIAKLTEDINELTKAVAELDAAMAEATSAAVAPPAVPSPIVGMNTPFDSCVVGPTPSTAGSGAWRSGRGCRAATGCLGRARAGSVLDSAVRHGGHLFFASGLHGVEAVQCGENAVLLGNKGEDAVLAREAVSEALFGVDLAEPVWH